MPNYLSQFWLEIRRRKVIPFLIGYAAACFAFIEFFFNASETFSLPEKTIRLLYLLSAVGIPVVILLPGYMNRKKAVTIHDDEGYKALMTRVRHEWENLEI
jgi:hypothetical protein